MSCFNCGEFGHIANYCYHQNGAFQKAVAEATQAALNNMYAIPLDNQKRKFRSDVEFLFHLNAKQTPLWILLKKIHQTEPHAFALNHSHVSERDPMPHYTLVYSSDREYLRFHVYYEMKMGKLCFTRVSALDINSNPTNIAVFYSSYS